MCSLTAWSSNESKVIKMNKHFTVGAVAGWLLLSLIYGRLLPVLSLPTILAVAFGGVVGVVVGATLSGGKGK